MSIIGILSTFDAILDVVAVVSPHGCIFAAFLAIVFSIGAVDAVLSSLANVDQYAMGFFVVIVLCVAEALHESAHPLVVGLA